MEFSITRESLLKPLQAISGVVEKRQTLPILSNVLIKAAGGKLSFTATDLEVEMIAATSLSDSNVSGEITVPARKFLDICRALPEGAEINFRQDGNQVIIKSGKSRFSLATLSAADFPSVDAIEDGLSLTVPQSVLKILIEKTHFAMAQQDVRYYLNGLMVEISEKGLRVVATDGHRLAMCDGPSDIKSEEIQQVIIPRKGIQELARLLDEGSGDITLKIGSNHVQAVLGDCIFTSKLIDGRFPDYQRVLPQGGDKVAIANRETLKRALSRVSILSNEKYRGVRFNLSNGLLKVQAHNPEQEEAEEEIEVDYSGGDLEIGFNVTYLIDVLNVIKGDEARIILIDSNSSCLIEDSGDENCRYVVMPMRL